MIIFYVAQMHKNKTLSKILDSKKLKNVDKPIELANGLPNECYISDEYFAYEKERVFCNKWTVIGVGSSVPNPGDVKPYNLLGIPLILVRGKDMKIRVFHNDETIRVYHSPQDVVVKPEAKKVEIHDVNGILIETYDLIERKLSWLEDNDIDTAEIMLDLKVNR